MSLIGIVASQNYPRAFIAELLVIAGGASGGLSYGGAGGAGGVAYHSGKTLTVGNTYTVTIGAGGAAKSTDGQGNDGNNSVFGDITANGGGGGGGWTGNPANANLNGRNGGSGGGASHNNVQSGTVGTATQGTSGGATGYGFNGGLGFSTYTGGGGGGAGELGNTDGNSFGGDGLNTWSAWATATSTGVSGFYAGGGGGATAQSQNTSGGSGGGGVGGGDTNQGAASKNGTAGTANTGSGGGGGYDNAPTSGAGGSGIVIFKKSGTYTAAATTGSPTRTVSGGFTYYVWTGSGSITI